MVAAITAVNDNLPVRSRSVDSAELATAGFGDEASGIVAMQREVDLVLAQSLDAERALTNQKPVTGTTRIERALADRQIDRTSFEEPETALEDENTEENDQ